MNTVLKSFLVLFGVAALAVVQYHFPQPWRYILGAVELGTLAVVLSILWDRTKDLARKVQEHQAQLDAIADIAEKSQVIGRAHRIRDAIITAPLVRVDREALDLPA